MNVRELMSNDVKSINSNSSVSDAAIEMRNLNVGVIPIVDSMQHVVGVITDRDIVLRCVAENCDLNSKKAHEVMSSHVMMVSPEADVNVASQMMADYQVRRLPVVENNQLVGILSLGDIATNDRCNCNFSKTLESISEK